MSCRLSMAKHGHYAKNVIFLMLKHGNDKQRINKTLLGNV